MSQVMTGVFCVNLYDNLMGAMYYRKKNIKKVSKKFFLLVRYPYL